MDHTLGCSLLKQLVSNSTHKTRSLADALGTPALWRGPSESHRRAEETMGPGGPAHTEFQDTYPRAMERQEGAGFPQVPTEVTFVVMSGISPILRTHFS